jgi:hypothetical protein
VRVPPNAVFTLHGIDQQERSVLHTNLRPTQTPPSSNAPPPSSPRNPVVVLIIGPAN